LAYQQLRFFPTSSKKKCPWVPLELLPPEPWLAELLFNNRSVVSLTTLQTIPIRCVVSSWCICLFPKGRSGRVWSASITLFLTLMFKKSRFILGHDIGRREETDPMQGRSPTGWSQPYMVEATQWQDGCCICLFRRWNGTYACWSRLLPIGHWKGKDRRLDPFIHSPSGNGKEYGRMIWSIDRLIDRSSVRPCFCHS
jgi:hypothetical protein